MGLGYIEWEDFAMLNLIGELGLVLTFLHFYLHPPFPSCIFHVSSLPLDSSFCFAPSPTLLAFRVRKNNSSARKPETEAVEGQWNVQRGRV